MFIGPGSGWLWNSEERMKAEQQRLVWRSIVDESRRRRRRRRREIGASMLALMAAVGGLGATRLLRDGAATTTRVAVAAGPAGTAPAPAGDPRAIGGGPVPSMVRLFALPPCSQDAGALTSWMVDALAPYVAVDPTAAHAEPLAAAGAVVAMPAEPPSAGACAQAIVAGDVHGWQLRAADGTLLGRGAGSPLTSRSVPSRLTGQRAIYHQESVASGQPFSGVVDGSRAEGLTSTGVIVVDVPSIVTSSTDSHAAGMQLLDHLSFASVAPIGLDVGFRLPMVAPSGFTRCTGDVGYLLQTGGTDIVFCDSEGRTITAGWNDHHSAGAPAGRPVDVNGFPGTVSDPPGKAASVSVEVKGPNGPNLYVHVDGFAGADATTLVSMLRSVGALDPRVLRPRAGTHDLRSLMTDNDRLQGILEAAGATSVVFPTAQPCPSVAGPSGILPCPLPAAISVAVPSGGTAMLFNAIVPQAEQAFAGLLPQATGVETVSGIDVLERDSAGTAGPRDAAQQALFVCGGVQFNFLGNDVFSFARALIPHLNC